MDTLPVELLRLIFESCDLSSVRNLREVAQRLATVGYEYFLPPTFKVLGFRNDIDRLHNIALHPRMRGYIQTVIINLSDIDDYDARHTAFARQFGVLPEVRQENLRIAWGEHPKIQASRRMQSEFHLKGDDLREAFLGLPNLRHIDITFNQCPVENEILFDVYGSPKCRRMDRDQACENLNTMVQALHGIHLDSFSCDRFPLEILKTPTHRRHWFSYGQSFSSLTQLQLTLDPSGLHGPAAAVKSINGLGYILQRPGQLKHLKLAFHPYQSLDSKFALSFREMLNGFTYSQLTDLTLEGISCEEDDLKEFLTRHGSTLRRLRLGGRGLSKEFEASRGGIHLYEGTFRSLFAGLRSRLPKLERFYLEGIFECEHRNLPSHEAYNFYPLWNEDWEPVTKPSWARDTRNTISCEAFERFVLDGGAYPGDSINQQHN